MAVVANPKDSKIRIKFNTGTDLEGNDTFKTKTLSKVKSSAIDDDVVAVVNDLASLQSYAKVAVTRVDETELTEA